MIYWDWNHFKWPAWEIKNAQKTRWICQWCRLLCWSVRCMYTLNCNGICGRMSEWIPARTRGDGGNARPEKGETRIRVDASNVLPESDIQSNECIYRFCRELGTNLSIKGDCHSLNFSAIMRHLGIRFKLSKYPPFESTKNSSLYIDNSKARGIC